MRKPKELQARAIVTQAGQPLYVPPKLYAQMQASGMDLTGVKPTQLMPLMPKKVVRV